MLAINNWLMLLFNLLPVCPLDGGQIFEAVMIGWKGMGKGKYISITTGIVVGAVVTVVSVVFQFPILAGLMAYLVVVNGKERGQARWLIEREEGCGLHETAVCPCCRSRAIKETASRCSGCETYCDFLVGEGKCRECGRAGNLVWCSYCGTRAEYSVWLGRIEAVTV